MYLHISQKAERYIYWPWAPQQTLFIDYLRCCDICICSVLQTIGAYCTTSKHYGPGRSFSCAHRSFSASRGLSVDVHEWTAPGGLFKTPTELCVEANENALKVNGPLRLNSPSYWLPVGAVTLLLSSEHPSHSPSSFIG